MTSEPVVQTPLGPLVPQYSEGSARHRTGISVEYYENGALKSIALERQTVVPTPLGPLPAEALTFYESGALKRLFPLNGKISGFWTEENERALTTELDVALPCGRLSKRVIGFHFYPGGNLQSITLWPGERVEVPTRSGRLTARVGLSFYEDGAVKSLEPDEGQAVQTPIGWLTAYDATVPGINGDSNSLVFDARGSVTAVSTCSCAVAATTADGKTKTYAPVLRYDEPVPVRLTFAEGTVAFNETDVYALASTRFEIRDVVLPKSPCTLCEGCSSCAGCHG